jgi:hypothetical protein
MRSVFPIFLFVALSVDARAFFISGTYQGKNLFFTHTRYGENKFWISINDHPQYSIIDSSGAFELSLRDEKFKIGDSIRLTITYRWQLQLKLLNPEALRPAISVMDSIKIEPQQVWWKCSVPAEVDHFNVKLVSPVPWGRDGKQNKGYNIDADAKRQVYFFNLTMYEERNVIALTYFMRSGKEITRTLGLYIPDKDSVRNYFEVKGDEFLFKSECEFEIYDKLGNKVRSGNEKRVSVKGLASDVYYLNYLNHTEEFIVTKKGAIKYLRVD